jgi:hypothetical protein
MGVRNGHRERSRTGTFGKTRISVPRARLTKPDGSTQEWHSASLRAYHISAVIKSGAAARCPS